MPPGGFALLVGASRKSFIGHVLGHPPPMREPPVELEPSPRLLTSGISQVSLMLRVFVALGAPQLHALRR
jgi:hypothetical protein